MFLLVRKSPIARRSKGPSRDRPHSAERRPQRRKRAYSSSSSRSPPRRRPRNRSPPDEPRSRQNWNPRGGHRGGNRGRWRGRGRGGRARSPRNQPFRNRRRSPFRPRDFHAVRPPNYSEMRGGYHESPPRNERRLVPLGPPSHVAERHEGPNTAQYGHRESYDRTRYRENG